MNAYAYVDGLKARHLCFHCTMEKYLGQDIKIKGKNALCDYCGEARLLLA